MLNKRNNNDSLFGHLGVPSPQTFNIPKPRTLFTGFGIWFLFCMVLGFGSLGTLAYVAYHFLSKVW